MKKQKGIVLIFCLAMLMIVSMYALTAMEKSRLLHKQVGAYSQSKQLQFLIDLTLIDAINEIKQADNQLWPKQVMNINTATGWSEAKLPDAFNDIAQADFYVQSLGTLALTGSTPKVNSVDETVLMPEAYLYRVTANVHLYKVYSRLFEIDYVKISYE